MVEYPGSSMHSQVLATSRWYTSSETARHHGHQRSLQRDRARTCRARPELHLSLGKSGLTDGWGDNGTLCRPESEIEDAAICHLGATRTYQRFGLGIEEPSDAFPPRNTIDPLGADRRAAVRQPPDRRQGDGDQKPTVVSSKVQRPAGLCREPLGELCPRARQGRCREAPQMHMNIAALLAPDTAATSHMWEVQGGRAHGGIQLSLAWLRVPRMPRGVEAAALHFEASERPPRGGLRRDLPSTAVEHSWGTKDSKDRSAARKLVEDARAAEEMQKKLLEPSAREKEAFEKEVMSALHHVDRVVRQITATKDAIAVAALMAVATSSLSLADATSSTSSLHSASKGLLKHFQKVRQGLFVKAAKKVALVRRLGVSQAVQEPTKPTKSLAEALAETLDKDARPRRMSQQGGFAALNLQHAALADRSTVVDKDSEAARRAPMLLHGASHAPPQLNSKTASQAKDDHSDTPSELQDEQAEDPMRHWTDGHLHEAQEGANGRRASRGQLVKKRASLMPWASMLPMASMVQDPQSEPEHLLGAPFAQAMSDPGPRRKVPATVFGGRFALSSAAKAGGPAASIGAVNAERLGGKPEELTFRAVSNERMVEQQTESARQQDPRMHPSTTADLSSMVMVAKKVSHSKSKEPVPLMCNLEEVPEEPDEDERQRQEPPESRSGAQSPATSSSGKASTTGGSDDVPARKVATLASALGTMSSALRSLPVGQQGKRKKKAKGMRFVLTEQSDGDDMTRRNAMFYVDELQAKVSRVRSGGWGAKMAMEPVLSDLLMASNCEAETLFETSLEEIKSKPQDQRGEIASRLVAMERARLRRPGRQTGQELPNEVVKACKQVLGELGSFITEGLPSESVSSSGGSDR
ncbi:unnamed protein product, partial [Prorocentrum cordatum]